MHGLDCLHHVFGPITAIMTGCPHSQQFAGPDSSRGDAQGTDLFVAGLMAVQKQKIGNSIVGFRDRTLSLPTRNASHDRKNGTAV